MNTDDTVQEADDTSTAIDALKESDPAESPDIAEGIASSLQRELDKESATTASQPEQPL